MKNQLILQYTTTFLFMLFGSTQIVEAQNNGVGTTSAAYISTTCIILVVALLAVTSLAVWTWGQHQKTILKLRGLVKEVEGLRQENDTLLQFNALAMHDLKSPLRTITSFTNLFLRKYGNTLNAEGQEFLTFVEEGGKRLERLLDGMPQSGLIVNNEKATVDTKQVLTDTLNNLRAEIDEKKAQVTIEGEFPVIKGGYGPVLQLFQNIIGNSLKYVAPDSTPAIRVQATTLLHQYVFSITDNGIGIASEHTESVFGRYVRLHDSKTYEGSGLGLANCRHIVEHMGGKIWLESDLGTGTTVFFTLPAKGLKKSTIATKRMKVERSSEQRRFPRRLLDQSRRHVAAL